MITLDSKDITATVLIVTIQKSELVFLLILYFHDVNMLRILCVEMYKIINKVNPEFMNNIFKVKKNKRIAREQYKLNLETPEWNQVTYGPKSLKVHGSKTSLPFISNHLKI